MKIVLVEPEYEGNLGMIARVVKNFGAEGLVLVNPKVEIGDETRRRAMHAQDILDNVETVDTLEDVRKKFRYLVGTTAKTANEFNVNRSYLFPWEIKKVEGMALVIGRESWGLTNEELEACDAVTVIPTSPKYRTMNISNAAAVLLYEFSKREEEREVADPLVREQIYRYWGELLKELDYVPKKGELQATLFKRVLEKAMMNEREAHGIAGVLNKTIKKVKNLNR